MAEGLLSGLRALDLTDEKGFICGKILASMGVEVIKVEKPGGDLTRYIPPFINNIPNSEKSLYWLAFNTDKKSITLDIEKSPGKEVFCKLVEKADFVLESFKPGYMDSLGLSYVALSRLNPRIIMTSITPFGQKGLHAGYKGSELIISAMSGVLDNCGYDDRPPVREGPDSIYYRGNAAAAFATVLAKYHCEIIGEGQQVDISLQEVDASRTIINLVLWEFEKTLHKRSGLSRTSGSHHSKQIWQCKDGYVFWMLSGALFGAAGNQALSQWLDDEGLENPLRQVKNWEEIDMSKLNPQTIEAWESAVGDKLFSKHTKKELHDQALKRGVDLCIINNPIDVLNNAQLMERDYWTRLENREDGESYAYPRFFFLSNQTENFVKRRSPFIGEDNEAIFGKLLALSQVEIDVLKEARAI